MFTRAVFLNMKPGCQAALARILEREVFELLQKDRHFRGLVAFLGGSYLIKSLGSKGCKIDSNIFAMDSAQEKAE
jgi:hypothetical protein